MNMMSVNFCSAENLVLIILDIIQMGRGTTLADS